MKKCFLRFAAVVWLMTMFAGVATANNDFLEQTQNYSVTPKGNGVLHFKIPIWSYGRVNNYRLGIQSHVWYSSTYNAKPNNDVTHFFYFRSTDRQNTDNPDVNSTADVDLRANSGTIKITRTAGGGTVQINSGSGNKSLTLPAQKSMDGSFKRVVYLEFDWYLPENLISQKFYVGVDARIFKYSADDTNNDNIYKRIWVAVPDRMDGSDQLMAPELQSPYLYYMDDNGTPIRDGKAAIPYVVYQTPKSYTTSISATPVQVTNRAGAIVVSTTDSIQTGFQATFTLQPNADVTTTTTRSTNRIDIPAFHRIYNFTAIEQKDDMDSYNGRNVLMWTLRSPQVTDLMSTDYFEIQRATKSDYSDAITIALEPMESGKGNYSFIDDTRSADAQGVVHDTTTTYRELKWNDYLLSSEDGDPLCDMDLKLVAKSQVLPASPIYYRVRRASTAAWEWNHPFAQATTLNRHSFLAPLAATQADYTKDADFENNHKVHFRVRIDNAQIMDQGAVTPQNCELIPTFKTTRSIPDSITMTFRIDENTSSQVADISIRIPNSPYGKPLNRGDNVLTLPVNGVNYQIWIVIKSTTMSHNGYDHDFSLANFTFDSDHAAELDGAVFETFCKSRGVFGGRYDIFETGYRLMPGTGASHRMKQAQQRWAAVRDTIFRQMVDSMQRTVNPVAGAGRCMWDRGAQLILMRTLQETGTTVELNVPQDSIRRNDDGSWTAHITDVANMACTNYSYQVRIDPSASSIRFQSPNSLQPVAINGPSLYFNEAASITSFTASKGDAQRERKSGVMLQWIPSSAAVDEYVLMRIPKGSTNAADTLYRGLDNSYFDVAAAPGKHYEYTVVTRYECKRQRTDHSATAEGWRTPYGEISGAVRQTDNSGMAGVTVTLAANGQTIQTVTTKADGVFLFDSLTYGNGTQYTVTPTSQYGTFSFNNTSSAVATVTLAADKCVQQGIDFVNTSSVRLSGRVLFQKSTIPVSGVCFILNGDTVRRGGSPYTSGIDGNFELTIPKSMPCRLRVAKAGHTFANDGWLVVTGIDTTFSLVKALDGVRFYDRTKVRLVGRVAGGLDQQALPPALGFGKNNLGDNLQLVLQLDGDNTAHIVHNPDDLTQDTLHFTVDSTLAIYEQKRIIIRPNIRTGEYAVDLFPVKYKVVQATATGYATLLDVQAGMPSFDLTNAPLSVFNADSLGRHATYNARFDRIYRNPMQVGLQQLMYGMVQDGMGEENIGVSSIINQSRTIKLYRKDSTGAINYLFGHPIFQQGRTYQFRVGAYEDYYYNNNRYNTRDRVRLSGGTLKVYNGFKAGNNTATAQYPLDEKGEAMISVEVDNINLQATGTQALRTLDLAVEREGNTTDISAVRGFVTGNNIESGDIRAVDADIKILDILRDPPGSGSSCYLEKGATYKSNNTWSIAVKFGVNIESQIGTAFDQMVGVIAVTSFTGISTEAGKTHNVNLPLIGSGKYSRTVSYTYTTSEKISTSSSPSFIGDQGDVFVGHMNEVLYGSVRAVRVIDDSTFLLRQPAFQAGYIKEVAAAHDSNGNLYHFVIAKELALGSRMGTQFAYTQKHIANTLIPKLINERNALLIDAPDSVTAQSTANRLGKAVYWNQAESDDTKGLKGNYKQIVPKNVPDYSEVDKVEALNNIIVKWVSILAANERDKVMAFQSGKKVGTFSVSGGTSREYSETYSADWTGGGNFSFGLNLSSIGSFFSGGGSAIATGATAVSPYATALSNLTNSSQFTNHAANQFNDLKVAGKAVGVQWETKFKRVAEASFDGTFSGKNQTISRKMGFTIAPDNFGNTTVSVYRSSIDSIFDKSVMDLVHSKILPDPDMDNKYGSFVFFQEGGVSHCPYEGEVRTQWYYPGQFVLGNATVPIENPKMTLDRYSISNVPAEQAAVFRLTLVNDNTNTSGMAARGQYLSLSVEPQTNPNGAIILIDGEPLTSASTLTFFCEPGVPIVKTVQVRRGIVDDYEDLTLRFASTTCASIGVLTKLSVHFIPESSPVNIAYPRDKWVMNTLSARDSVGYYLPVTIDGFNIHHKNFDHIEFQYKLSTENNEAWVTACSFYADDELYNAATGNKAKIINGRIEPFRFYGERDPKELNYDLRAVSFCRYGSGFVTKSSPVISGTKDTRPPVLFGKASPANGILTLKDNISMRFSEPIAGNWLDEDNNFQILGVTNTTGITQTTSLYFDGENGHYARTKVERELAITDLSIDMLIKPASKNREMTLFSHGDAEYNFAFSLTADNRLKLTVTDAGEVSETLLSKKMGELSSTDFTRVIMVYDSQNETVRFYAGTQDITDKPSTRWMLQNDASIFRVGATIDSTTLFHGNMMETRIWTKPLTPAEISNTHLRHLTGYEYGLANYYPMNENKGEELSDLATGATLFAKGLSWTRPQGISLATNGDAVQLQPTYFARSEAEDYTLLFWFRSDNSMRDTVSLFGTSVNDSTTLEIALHNGEIQFRAGTVDVETAADLTDGNWHYCALVISKTFNNGSLAIDGKKLLLFPALETGALSGTKVWMAKGLRGHIDEVCLFEQPMPSELVREFYQQSPNGEEMGLINLLSFSELKRNAANVMELVFSPNNRRVFRDANGNVVQKVQPLIVGDLSAQADKRNSAPIRDRGQLTRLPFTWNYQLSDLMINIKAQPREINKRTMYLTVRDVEDINGNRLPSPVMWTVYADLNSVVWNARSHQEKLADNEQTHRFTMTITNTTGITRQFTIENLPRWLTVSPAQGTLNAEEQKTITFTIKAAELKIGTHHHMVYLTDDQGLTESLLLEVIKETEPPYTNVDLNKYPTNMSLCGRVLLTSNDKRQTTINTDPEDYVYAIYNNECIGVAHPMADNQLKANDIFLTIHGNDHMERKTIRFQLWKASTGKVYNLTPDRTIHYAHGAVLGCGNDEPVILTAGGSEMQTIALKRGWNWISTYLKTSEALRQVITAENPWTEGDIIKNPSGRSFCTYSRVEDDFVGPLKKLDYRQMYMVYTATDNSMHIFGDKLSEDSLRITVQGGGKWNALPCLLDQVTILNEALSDYYGHASVGDLIKAHNRFAVFSSDNRWVGDLTALTPGEGYLFRRMGEGPVTFRFFRSENPAPARANTNANADAATNMTMIARIEAGDAKMENTTLYAYIGSDLVGVAEPFTSPEGRPGGVPLYFLTISSDAIGSTLRFELADGTVLTPSPCGEGRGEVLSYDADAHYGSLTSPVVLTTNDELLTTKVFENGHIYIIRGGERYDMTGKRIVNKSSNHK